MKLEFKFTVSLDRPYLQLFVDEEGTKKEHWRTFFKEVTVLVSLVCGNRGWERKPHGTVNPPPCKALSWIKLSIPLALGKRKKKSVEREESLSQGSKGCHLNGKGTAVWIFLTSPISSFSSLTIKRKKMLFWPHVLVLFKHSKWTTSWDIYKVLSKQFAIFFWFYFITIL